MKRYVVVSNPATGQLKPIVAITEELVLRGNKVVVLSADSVLRRVQKIQGRLHLPEQMESRPSKAHLMNSRLSFYSLGTGVVMDDYTNIAHTDPLRFHGLCRSVPGDIWGWLRTFTDLVPPDSDNYRDTVFAVRDAIDMLDPDMLIVDNFSPFAVDGVRLTKRPFIQTSPGASSAVTCSVDLWRAPLPMSGGREARFGIAMFMHNLYFLFAWLWFIFFDPWANKRRQFRRNVLGLEPVDRVCDSIMTPTPGMLKQQVATLSFNVANMDFYSPDSYDKSVYFVGPCFSPPPQRVGIPPPLSLSSDESAPSTPVTPGLMTSASSIVSTPTTLVDVNMEKEYAQFRAITRIDPLIAWLDKAYASGNRVVYINMGSIFFYTLADYETIVRSLVRLHDRFPSVQILWKVPDLPYESQPIPTADESSLPPYIRRESWLDNVDAVLQHPATAVCVHHGGGNSYNEALLHGIPQFCISQWVDTHDIGSYVKHSGIGIWSDKSPVFDEEDISNNLGEMLVDKDNVFRRNALSWKMRTGQAGGTTHAVNIIEEVTSSFPFPNGSSKVPML
ncbi:hypothetical protein MSPP1_001669 [Malassezia sp. CBS 17886]|nr:hypothetical protein MSPP1_001669 [Malassezia sp. CBS 17886]